MYSLGNSIFTGIIASIIVTVIIQKKQDKEQFERKRAVLFDAGFYLKKFEQDYNEKKKTNSRLDDDREQLFELCREPEEIVEVHDRFDKEIKELKENLFYLLIKWEKDSVIDYEIPH